MSESENRGPSPDGPDGPDGPEIATLAGGCFWCLEAVYDELEGVLDVVSGYAGGQVPNPTYEAVCSGDTGHAEVVQVTFDPQRISYRDLLEVFFSIHDPTTLNRQGMDVGTQYRSAIYYHSPRQEQVARETIADLERQRLWPAPIVTEVTPLDTFYPAEEYHQEYFARNPYQGYCLMVIRPKVAKFRKQHLNRLKKRSA
jgi:peptide-methionine (S)-S-oxide reductase